VEVDPESSPKTNLGKLLSNYYDDSAPNAPESPVSMYASEAEKLPSDLGLEAILSKWKAVIREENELKGEMKSLLYENCDKFFTCVHLISKLNGDIEVMQSKNIGEINIPIIVRLQGTNAELGAQIISDSGLKVFPAILLKEAADKIKEVLA
jgi:hypothetical protein